MTRAEVIAMARGVGIWCTLTDVACAIDALERFAALVAAAEREACEPLIRQLVAALEGYRRNHNDTQPCDAERAGRAWLEGAEGDQRISDDISDVTQALRAAIATPQQEAQEPVAVVVPCHTPSGKRVALYSAKQDLPVGTQLYTAPQPSPAAQGDAELGRTAMRFVDRAGDVHPGIDDAETICAEFYKAMSDVIEKMPHVQRMQPSMSAPASQEVKSHDN